MTNRDITKLPKWVQSLIASKDSVINILLRELDRLNRHPLSVFVGPNISCDLSDVKQCWVVSSEKNTWRFERADGTTFDIINGKPVHDQWLRFKARQEQQVGRGEEV